MEGVNGKKRFTIRFVSNNNQELSFGDHNPNSNDNADILQNGLGEWFLYINDNEGNIRGFYPLPYDTLVCNGWYSHERDEFVPVKDFVWK